MPQVTFIEDATNPEAWHTMQTDNVCECIKNRLSVWPEFASIYHGEVAELNDVTPNSDADIDKLMEMPGPFYIVVLPEELVTWAVVAIIAVVAVVAFMPKPNIPVIASRNIDNSSSNNKLSDRSNKARPNARIPDILGTVRAIPDLLAMPYSVYVDNVEYIYDYMCVGRGKYNITDIRDGQTRINQIKGASAEVYDPFHSPNDGVIAMAIGAPIGRRVLNVTRSKSVNGQTLIAPNDVTERADYLNKIRFEHPNIIRLLDDTAADFTDTFSAGDSIFVRTSNHRNYDGGYMFNFSGVYTVDSVTPNLIMLLNPGIQNDSWNHLAEEDASNGNGGAYGIPGHKVSIGVPTDEGNWVGPFVIDSPDVTAFIANFFNPNGMYKDDGREQFKTDVTVEIGLTPIGVDGLAYSGESYFQITIEGSSASRESRAVTLGPAELGFKGRFSARARRITPKDFDFDGQISDDVKWRDLYGVAQVSQPHFGNITTIQTVTMATPNALALNDRELNLLATRKIPAYASGAFTTELYASNSFADIFCFAALDPKIGRWPLSQLDVNHIYAIEDEIIEYFGTTNAAQFCYTLDKTDLTAEETLHMIAEACFCQAFKRAGLISLYFIKKETDPVLILNHRNKIPKSEKRTLRFGRSEFDGVEYQYISPNDDSVVTLYIPEDQSATNPKQIESVGVRNHRQAHFQANRIWNRLRYSVASVECEALQETYLLFRSNLVLCADNTNPKLTSDGEVEGQTGLELTLSQKHKMVAGKTYLIFLQLYDETVQSITVTPGASPYKVLLQIPPRLPLSLDEEASVKTLYTIVETGTEDADLFLIDETTPNDNFTLGVKLINYTDDYYKNDKDYVDEIIT